MHSLCTAPKTQPRPTALLAPRWIRLAQQGSPGEVSSWVSSLPLLSASLLVRLSPHSTDFPSRVRGLPFLPQYTNCPVWMPSAAMNSSVRFLNRYGSRKTTLARGAPRPGSWMISCGPRRRERGVPGGRLIPPPAADRAPYLHDALDVAVPLGEVHGAQTRGSFAVLHVRAEHGAGALPLPTDHAAHGGSLGAAHCQRPGGPKPSRRPASGPSFPRLLPPVPGPLGGPIPGRAPWCPLRSPLGSFGDARAEDGGGWHRDRRYQIASYLLPSATEREDAAPASVLIFRGRAKAT